MWEFCNQPTLPQSLLQFLMWITVARQTYTLGLLIPWEKCIGHKGFAYSETSTSTIVPALGTGLPVANIGKNPLLYSEISQGNAMPGCFTQALKRHFEITQR